MEQLGAAGSREAGAMLYRLPVGCKNNLNTEAQSTKLSIYFTLLRTTTLVAAHNCSPHAYQRFVATPNALCITSSNRLENAANFASSFSDAESLPPPSHHASNSS